MARKEKYYRRPDGLFEAIRTIGGKRVAFRGKTCREVDRKILEYREEAERGRTVGAIADAWEEAMEPRITEASRVAYRAPLRRLKEHFGAKRAAEVKPIDLQRLLLKMAEEGYQFGTVKLMCSIQKQVFRYAVIQGDLEVSPAAEIETPKNLPRKRRDALSPEQIRSVTECRTGNWWLLGLMFLYTGCRRGELMALRYEDIDRRSGTITINKKFSYATGHPVLEDHTKTDAGIRRIPLLSPLADALPRDRIGLIFTGKNGGPMNPHEIDKAWHEYCMDVGLVEMQTVTRGKVSYQKPVFPITPHYFRHTFATICYDADVDTKSAADMMGHASDQITREIYDHLTRSRKQRSAEKLEAYVEQVRRTEAHG